MQSSGREESGDKWSLVDVHIDADLVDVVSDVLWSLGVAAIEERPMPEGVVLRTSVGDDPSAVMAHLGQQFPTAIVVQTHVSRSVAETWREYAEEIVIDDSFKIVPAWKRAGSDSDHESLFIEPGHTFGLGNHPTTRLTLRAARRWVKPGTRVHDHGCGSGILALALSKTHNCELSVDDIAVGADEVVRHNAQLNDLAPPQWRQDGLRGLDKSCDAVLANILAPVLREHACDLEAAVRSGGLLILSGLRTEQHDSVIGCFQSSEVIAVEHEDGWEVVVLRTR